MLRQEIPHPIGYKICLTHYLKPVMFEEKCHQFPTLIHLVVLYLELVILLVYLGLVILLIYLEPAILVVYLESVSLMVYLEPALSE